MKHVFVIMAIMSIGLKLAADIDSTSLQHAIVRGDLKTVIELQDISQTSNHSLIYALRQNHYEIAMMLLDKGVRTDVEDENGDTPLITAMKNHVLTERLLRKILAQGASIDHVHAKTGMTAMMYGAKSGFVRGMKLLSDFGASLDRINTIDGKSMIDYVAEQATFEFLMKSHRYLGKSLARYGYTFVRDQQGCPVRMAVGSDSVVYHVKKGDDFKVVKFCYNRLILENSQIVEYEKCRDNEAQLGKFWNSWFGNKMRVQGFDVFTIRDFVKGKTLAHWMKGSDPERNIASRDPKAALARAKLKELIVRMLKQGWGFVGDMHANNLMYSEDSLEWVVVDGSKAVACYSPTDHEWIWLEYCQASMDVSQENLLKAFKSFTIGPNPTGNHMDDRAFGMWLKPRLRNGQLEEPSDLAKATITELISGIALEQLQ